MEAGSRAPDIQYPVDHARRWYHTGDGKGKVLTYCSLLGASTANDDLPRKCLTERASPWCASLSTCVVPVMLRKRSETESTVGWHHRPRSPGLQWHKNYTGEGLHCGRVLMIDYVRKGRELPSTDVMA